MEEYFRAWNKITGLFWNGSGFNGSLAAQAVKLDRIQVIALQYTYENVEFNTVV